MALPITSPNSPALAALCSRLQQLAPALETPGAWPAEQLQLCGEAGVFEWFLEPKYGGQGWCEADLARGYMQLAAACVTTAFVITQRVGALTRIAAYADGDLRNRLLSDLLAGQSFATIGISHLTTSRRHLAQPVMRAEETAAGFLLDGYSPWVTGAEFAQHVVLGAELADGRQILCVLPTNLPGVTIPRSPELVALSGSRTGELLCQRVLIERELLLAGPMPEVMKAGLAAKTGGLQTSALALGLTTAALDFLADEATRRPDLLSASAALREELCQLTADLLQFAAGNAHCTNDELRTRANSLVLRGTQAALAAAKGEGFVASHPAGRWCRQALFFLVWSCPPGVVQANLCELAGL